MFVFSSSDFPLFLHFSFSLVSPAPAPAGLAAPASTRLPPEVYGTAIVLSSLFWVAMIFLLVCLFSPILGPLLMPTDARRFPMELRARLAFAVHHSFVFMLALHAFLLPSDNLPALSSFPLLRVRLMSEAMIHEFALNLIDFLHISFTRRSLTGLNYVGLALHHLVACIALGFSLHFGLSVDLAIFFCLLLDGTGALDYFGLNFLTKTKFAATRGVAAFNLVACAIFFALRLFVFPFLLYRMAWEMWAAGFFPFLATLVVAAGSIFFNVGMIEKRLRDVRKFMKIIRKIDKEREEWEKMTIA